MCLRADETVLDEGRREALRLAEQSAEKERRNAEFRRYMDERHEASRLRQIEVDRYVRETRATFKTWVGS